MSGIEADVKKNGQKSQDIFEFLQIFFVKSDFHEILHEKYRGCYKSSDGSGMYYSKSGFRVILEVPWKNGLNKAFFLHFMSNFLAYYLMKYAKLSAPRPLRNFKKSSIMPK